MGSSCLVGCSEIGGSSIGATGSFDGAGALLLGRHYGGRAGTSRVQCGRSWCESAVSRLSIVVRPGQRDTALGFSSVRWQPLRSRSRTPLGWWTRPAGHTGRWVFVSTLAALRTPGAACLDEARRSCGAPIALCDVLFELRLQSRSVLQGRLGQQTEGARATSSPGGGPALLTGGLFDWCLFLLRFGVPELSV